MKKTVFLTGATGNMGWSGFQEILRKKDRFDIRLLARDSRKNRKLLAPYMDDPAVTIIWGDLMNYDDVLRGVTGSDFVLHVGGMVSPAADYYPEKTLRVNVGSAENVVRAVLAQPDADRIRLVYIGSVAQYGNRSGETLWGRTGDPQRASLFDAYSVSKCRAEKVIVDSGIKHWVSLRQSGILYGGILKVVNPTAFHVPIRGALEWATVEDSGRLLANVIEDWVPEEFWNRFYNISSGEQYRMSNYEFETRMLASLGLPGPEKVFEPQWFVTRNFHGMWYTDADELENYLHFRENLSLDEYFARLRKGLPWFYRLAFLVPAWAVKMFMKPYAFEKGLGTQSWVNDNPEKIAAYYGSLEEYRSIRTWAQMRPGHMEKNLERAILNGDVTRLDHGYDESVSIYSLTAADLEAAAAFRGGRFLGPASSAPSASAALSAAAPEASAPSASSVAAPEAAASPEAATEGGWAPGTLFEWECEHGHRFTASLEYVLLGGGWCPECGYLVEEPYKPSSNRFLSQVLL